MDQRVMEGSSGEDSVGGDRRQFPSGGEQAGEAGQQHPRGLLFSSVQTQTRRGAGDRPGPLQAFVS